MIVYCVHDYESNDLFCTTKREAFQAARDRSRTEWDMPENCFVEVSRDVVTKLTKSLVCNILSQGGQWCESSVTIAKFRNGRLVETCHEVVIGT